MKISQNGIDLIKKYEGCHLTAYKCPSNVWTIGYGHVIGVTEGMTITQQQAEDFLREDLNRYEIMSNLDLYVQGIMAKVVMADEPKNPALFNMLKMVSISIVAKYII